MALRGMHALPRLGENSPPTELFSLPWLPAFLPSSPHREVCAVPSLGNPGDLSKYSGRHYWVPASKRLFGGQIVGQALVAAAKSVSEDVHVHSLHCYFVRAGKPPTSCPNPALVAQQPFLALGAEVKRKRGRLEDKRRGGGH
ncbi:hypothetical protein P7K49_009806 [Saguinus oedipus]|uniref:Acyl-CoA thioesterase-like N-terminal HotDog domain-containing protein n=1 Tax=Saguinus oedipus TaxID=9490 RepID=A0ABQ9VL11_SAGOE|nr:hypothetical protein P7K49_009806 [Saguinus oedipus]